MNKKRVGCLYRVSTKKQVEENDIPMQKNSCREFIKNNREWVLEKEYIELGISGYKLSETERDKLQEIKKDVLNRKIDILVVFMFDRIGRREEETPFVVEWLIQQGIEVWSVKEGQRKIENRADKLMNYLTYWQAGGESEKTSIRVKEAQLQMAENGILTYGGRRNAPYGYEFVKSGTYTKKGVERQKLIINEFESKIVYRIYNLYTVVGYGAERIARKLNKEGIKPRRGKLWNKSSIIVILKNPIYMGYPAYRKSTTQKGFSRKTVAFEEWVLPENKIEDYVIVSEKTWYKAKEIREGRKNYFSNNDDNSVYHKPTQTKSELLFIGMIKCGECGYSFMTSKCKKKVKNGDIHTHLYYKCTGSRITECTLFKKSIKKADIEEPILKIINDFLDNTEKIDLSKALINNQANNSANEQKELRKCEQKIMDNEKKLTVLKEELVKTLMGTSNFSQELLNQMIEEKKQENEKLLKQKSSIEETIEHKNIDEGDVIRFKNMIPIWKKEFKNADIETKKMLLSEIIREIRVYNTRFEIDFQFKIDNYMNRATIVNNKLVNADYKIIENTICLKKE